MFNSIIKFTPRIDKIYPQGANLPPIENPWSKVINSEQKLDEARKIIKILIGYC